ncbi:hypothetical protein CEP54_001611 [Fusarium duplospermum]|uniref:Helicase ATP-binding domain-containing protein n=1 Tax=Fusarium duplospermum TaxID=1325734 RepID=A0A428R093_9HYPO|nr:hypothetical protein CEP54_001611 [Fusarium duplospermum]
MPEQYHVVTEVFDLIFPPQPEGFEGLKSTVAKLGLPFLDLLESPGFVQALNHLTASETEPTLLSRLQTKLLPCQAVGVTKLLQLTETPFKGVFLCDEAGMGKSLTALTAALIKREQMLPDCGFVLVKHFKKDSQPSCIILDSTSTPVTELLRHQVVICSTTFLLKTFDEYQEYFEYSGLILALGIESATPLLPNQKLERPNLPLHCDTYNSLNKRIAALILDESHYAHDAYSQFNQALRSIKCHSAFLLSGAPIKSSWRDLYGQTMILPGSPFQHIEDFDDMFETGPGEDNGSVPEGVISNMFQRYFMGQILSRPKSALNLPDWTRHVVPVISEPRDRYNYLVIVYLVCEAKRHIRDKKFTKDGMALINKAHRLANHPVLLDGPQIDIKTGAGNKQRSIPSRSGGIGRANKEWTKIWLQRVRDMDTVELLSPRIRTIVSTVNDLLRCHQDEKVVIALACVKFLDLLFEALCRDVVVMDKKRMIAQYDLSVEVDKRASIIDAFSKPTDMAKKAQLREALRMTDDEEKRSRLLLDMEKADGLRILLLDANIAQMSSVDLNLTRASRIILCHSFGAPDIAPLLFDKLSEIDILSKDLIKPIYEPTRAAPRFYTRLDTDAAQDPDAPTREQYALALRELSKNKEEA